MLRKDYTTFQNINVKVFHYTLETRMVLEICIMFKFLLIFTKQFQKKR